MANKELNVSDRLINLLKGHPKKFVDMLIAEAEPILQRSAQRWKRYRHKYRVGLTHLRDLKELGSGMSFRANYIYGNVETVKSSLPKGLETVVVRAYDVDDKPGDGLLSKLLTNSLTKAGLWRVLKQGAGHHATITGLGWLKITIEPEAYFGQPDNIIDAPLPENVLVDPNALPFYDGLGRVNARYIIERRRNVSLEEVEALFDIEIKLEEGEDTPDTGLSHSAVDGPDRIKPAFGNTKDMYDVWVNTFDKKKPWWHAVMWGNKVVVKPEASPYNHPYPPYVPVWMGYDDGADDFYQAAIGEVEEIESMQDKANFMDMSIMKSIRQIVNRQRIVNKSLGLSAANVDNTDGRVYAVPGNTKEAITWDNPPMLTTDVYTYRMMVDYIIEVVSGVTGTQAGRKPTGIQAAKALQQLSTNSDKRIEDRRTDVSFAIERIGEMGLSNIFQYWTDSRIVNLMDGGATVVIGDYPEPLRRPDNFDELDPEEQQAIAAQQEQFKQENGVSVVLAELKRNSSIHVSTNTALPEARGERTQMAADALRLGGIDRRAFLEALDWPNREEILARLGENQAGKAAADGGLQQTQQQPQIDPNQLVPIVQQIVMQLLGMGGGQAPPAPEAGGVPGDIPPELLAQLLGQGGD